MTHVAVPMPSANPRLAGMVGDRSDSPAPNAIISHAIDGENRITKSPSPSVSRSRSSSCVLATTELDHRHQYASNRSTDSEYEDERDPEDRRRSWC